MKLNCKCGYAGYVESVNLTCPQCHGNMGQGYVDFEEFRPLLENLFDKIKLSVIKHGDWPDYDHARVFETVAGEFDEYREAFLAENVTGRHGQINELYDLMVVAVKGIRRLSCLQ
jgi:hypothetical protein